MTYGRILIVDVWGRPPGPNSRRQHWAVAADNVKWKEKAQIAAIEAMKRADQHRIGTLNPTPITETAVASLTPAWPIEEARPYNRGPRGKITYALHRSTEPMERALVEYEFVVSDDRDRDWDNLVASTKPLMDGCVAAGVIRDDGIHTLIERRTKVTVQDGVRKTRLKFAEVLDG